MKRCRKTTQKKQAKRREGNIDKKDKEADLLNEKLDNEEGKTKYLEKRALKKNRHYEKKSR